MSGNKPRVTQPAENDQPIKTFDVFVAKIPREWTPDDLKTYAESVLPGVHCAIVVSNDAGNSKGFGFVKYLEKEKCKQAVIAINQDGKVVAEHAMNKAEKRKVEQERGQRDGRRTYADVAARGGVQYRDRSVIRPRAQDGGRALEAGTRTVSTRMDQQNYPMIQIRRSFETGGNDASEDFQRRALIRSNMVNSMFDFICEELCIMPGNENFRPTHRGTRGGQ